MGHNALDSFGDSVRVAVIGASGGIGTALLEHLAALNSVEKIFACARSEIDFYDDKIAPVYIDITDEKTIANAAQICGDRLDVVIVATGMLQGTGLPEKSFKDLDFKAMRDCFAVNTFGPALVAKHFLPLLPKDSKSVFAALSARVGSVSDNGIGGWYSYRASKAALNMMIKNCAIEVGRRFKHAAVIGLHPGTVETALSEPFLANVHHDIFSPEQAAYYLLNVINQVNADESGTCFDWNGQEIMP